MTRDNYLGILYSSMKNRIGIILLLLWQINVASSSDFFEEMQEAENKMSSGDVLGAIVIYHNLLQKSTPQVQSNRDYLIQRLVSAYVQMYNYQAAENIILSELKKGDNFNLNVKLAEIYEKMNEMISAEKIYLKLLDVSPGEWIMQKLLLLWEKMKLDTVKIKELKEDKKIISQEMVGEYYILKKMYPEAISQYKKLLEMSPYNVNYLNKLAEGYLQNNDYENALIILEKIIKVQPYNTYTYKKMGDIYYKKKEKDKAISLWQKYANYSPQDVSSFLQLASIYQEHHLYEEAIKMHWRARKMKGDDFLYAQQVGWLYQQANEQDNAVYEYGKSIIKEPQNFSYYKDKIKNIFQSADDKSGLIVKVEELYYKFPKNYYLLQLLSEMYIESDLTDKVIELSYNLSEGERLNLWSGIADNLMRENKYSSALKFYEKISLSASQKTQKISALLQRANILRKMGLFPQAIYLLQNILLEYPSDILAGQSYFYLGEIYEDIDLFEAIESYNKFLLLPQSEKTTTTRIRLANCFFKKIKLEEAKAQYNNLILQTYGQDKEYCVFMVSLCDYYLNNFSSAKDGFQNFVEMYPNSFLVNDALEKIGLIKMYSDYNFIPLKLYAEGEMQSTAKNFALALDGFKTLIKYYPEYPLSEMARLLMSKIYKDKGLYDLAREAFEEFLLLYPLSYLRDEVYFELFHIYKVIGEEEKSIAFYHKLKQEFPESFYLP